MINIHIYPSDFKNESRILRTASAIENLSIFEQIELVGILGNEEKLSAITDKIVIRRFPRKLSRSFSRFKIVRKLYSHFFWLYSVFLFYKSKKISCINAHCLTVLPLCVLLKLFTGAKLIYDTHELETRTNGSGFLRSMLSQGVECFFIKFVDHSIFVSESINNWYVNKYKLKNCSVVLNCPLSKELSGSQLLREQLNIGQNSLIFLYQGVLSQGRGIELLIKAFSQLSQEYVLVLMGYGSLQYQVKEADSKYPNIYFKEAVPPEDLLLYTCSADFGLSVILPTSLSYEFCMPNKLFEYVNSGLPVIVSPTIEQANFVSNNEVGCILDRIDITCIQNTVKAIAKRGTYFRPYIQKAQSKYNWHQESKKISAIYNNLF